jgi:hypothetical protein
VLQVARPLCSDQHQHHADKLYAPDSVFVCRMPLALVAKVQAHSGRWQESMQNLKSGSRLSIYAMLAATTFATVIMQAALVLESSGGGLADEVS